MDGEANGMNDQQQLENGVTGQGGNMDSSQG